MATSQKSQVLRIIIQNTMQSNEDAYLFNRDLLNALLLPKDAVPSHEWTAAQQESFVYTLRQTLLSIQWKAYVLHSFVKHIASVPCQHNTKVDIQSQLLNQIISYWGDLMFIQSANQFKQLNVTHAIFVMIKYFAPKIVENIAHTSVFLDGVNRRLDSTVSLYRKIGMITAESFSNIASPTDSKLNFELDKDDPEVVTDTLDDPDAIIQSIDAISEEEEEEEEEKEEKDDVSEENGAWKTKKPKYLRDLIQYLSCEDDVDKWMVGIIAAAELIHIVHNQDLAVWVIPLTRRLVYLQDVYEQPEFIPCLCAALTVLMEKSEVATEQIIDFIGNRDCSLSRRVLLLECLRQTTHRLNQLPTSTDKKSKISKPSGTVVWTSMRLSLQSPQHGTTQWMQRHSTVIHHLLNLSVNADNRHLMLQDTLVLRPYIATLSDMISLSKNAPDIWPLCNTLLELLMPLRYHPNAEILEVVLIGLISVVSALNANVHTDFLSFIRPIHDWLAALGVFEAPIAAQLQPQIVALGSALSAFAEKAETNIYTMLDRMEV
ncbi:hypothetical protein BDF19DRAFT_411956 [Syncephalis fuscata]|nr:hypothetical protein BDF19DRAFT_411956 [Syncephalis fuscata]